MRWLLLLYGFTSYAGDFPARNLCHSTAGKAYHDSLLENYLAGVDGMQITGKDGQSYKILTTSIDRSEAKENSPVPEQVLVSGRATPWKMVPHQLEVVDSQGNIVGWMKITAGADHLMLDQIKMREAYQDKGLTTQVLEPLARSMAPGSKLRLYSGNVKTNQYLSIHIAPLMESIAYKRIVAERGQEAGDVYLSQSVTQYLNDHPGDRGALWPNLLRKAGWKSVSVKIEVDNRPEFSGVQFYVYGEK